MVAGLTAVALALQADSHPGHLVDMLGARLVKLALL